MIRNLLQRRRKKLKQDYDRGYDWAAGALLRGWVVVSVLEEQICTETDPFDKGALQACNDYERR